MRPAIALAAVFALAAALVPACASPAPTRLTQCARQTIGVAGGAIVSPSGAAASFGPGALPTDIEVSICVVEIGHVPRQHSPVVEFGPTDLFVASSVQLTMPIDDTTPLDAIAELRATPSGDLLTSFLTFPAAPGFVTFTAPRFGDFRIMENTTSFDGAVPNDAGAEADDVNRLDAPRPIGPVVVGPDLTPAAYDCLGTLPLPVAGAPTPVTVHVTDWADHTLRADYDLHALPLPAWTEIGGCTDPGCDMGTSDAAGDATMMLAPGPVWFVSATSATMTRDLGHLAAAAWTAGLVLETGATRIDVPVLSQRTQQAISNALTFGNGFVLGQVRDCDGALVQRVRVRMFDAASDAELLGSFFGGPAVAYGNGVGFPGGTSDRTTLDGIYLGLPATGGDVRVEAWGRRVLGGDDVLLGCDVASFASGLPVVLDLRPLRAGAPSTCGSVP